MALNRRDLLAGLGAIGAGALAGPAGRAAERPGFSHADVVALAAARAARPYENGPVIDAPLLTGLDYDAWRRIVYRRERALWADIASPAQVQFFPAGYLFPRRIAVHEVAGGIARPLPFDPDAFHWHGLMRPPHAGEGGWAGLRLLGELNAPGRFDEVIAFIGASYFRALGRGQRYGISARALALDVGGAEEFPAFTDFWLERPAPGATRFVVHALFDSPGAAGAIEIATLPGATTRSEIRLTLFARRTLTAAGLMPLTSMFWRGPLDPRPADDHRPAVHDSEGLMLATHEGPIWRPLANPSAPRFTRFAAKGVHGFGLLQRQRAHARFADTEAFYDLRPSAWITPRGRDLDGEIVLYEWPTANEYADNVVAFHAPARPIEPGTAFEIAYAIDWRMPDPEPATRAWLSDSHIAERDVDGTALRVVAAFTGTRLPSPETLSVQVATDSGTVEAAGVFPTADGCALELRRVSGRPTRVGAHLTANGTPISERIDLPWT